MAYDEQETTRRKVVVETPTARREVTQTHRESAPESNGTSSAAVAVMVILGVAVIALLGLVFWSMQANSNNNENLAAQQQPTPQTIIQQPAQQAPIIVQQPAPATQPAPIIVNPPASAPAGGSALSIPDDGAIQTAIDKKLHNDSTLSTLDITASVINGKVLLVGKVKSEQLKSQVEKTVRAIKGVLSIDNQITVSS
jgi:flagellar basal body-associated protein FliL